MIYISSVPLQLAENSRTLPVPFPDPRDRVSRGGADSDKILLTVGITPMILASSHFTSIGAQVLAADMVVDAYLGAAYYAREKRLGVIGASAIVGIALLMVGALRQIAAVECVPMPRLVGMSG